MHLSCSCLLFGFGSAILVSRRSVRQQERRLMLSLAVSRFNGPPRAFHHGLSDSDDEDYGFDSYRDSGSNFY